MKQRYLLVLAALLIQCGTAPDTSELVNKFHDPQLQQLYDWQDQRDSERLLDLLSHPDSTIRWQAATAFGSVQDAAATRHLITLLDDVSSTVRVRSAYALGQLYDSTIQEQLIHHIKVEENELVLNSLLEALGKCSTVRSGLTYLTQLQSQEDIEWGIAWGLYRAGLKGLQSPPATQRILQLLNSEQASVRLGASHYLARTRGLELAEHLPLLIEHCHDPDPEIRMALALALGKAGDGAKETLAKMIKGDADYRVRVNAIRALPNMKGDSLAWNMLFILQDTNVHVAYTAASFMKEFAPPAMADTLEGIARQLDNIRVSAMLYGAALNRAPVKSRLTAFLQESFQEATNPYHQAFYVEALAGNIHNYSFLKGVLFGDHHPVVTTSAINAIYEINGSKDFRSEWREEFIQTYQRAIASGDVAMMGVAAQALRDQALGYINHLRDTGFIDEAMGKLTLPRDIETYQDLQHTKNYLERSEFSIMVRNPFNNPIDWDFLVTIPAHQQIMVSTSRGDLTMELMLEHSPATVAYIWKLMQEGFYQDKTFHRVVPNFVAQGGCPRGDGWGSTDSSIRSELGPSYYGTGFVGIASAGKDTESCQWFITHSPAPHLDGRYTIFARIKSGMTVVHQLEAGDKIIDIKAL